MAQSLRHRGTAVVDAQLAAGIADVKVDRAFGHAQDDAGFPAGFAQGRPVQAIALAEGQGFGLHGKAMHEGGGG